jgi:hypothetical protein
MRPPHHDNMAELKDWIPLISQLGIPALVAATVTAIMNWLLEKRRGRREANNRSFELARDGAREFARLAAIYWLKDRSEDDPKSETQIMLVQQDILVDVAACIELCPDADRDEIETALDELVRFGTGGDFQVVTRKSDLPRVRQIAGAAARLRKALAYSRRRLLEQKGY